MPPPARTMAQQNKFLHEQAALVDLVAAETQEDAEGEMDLDLCEEQELAKVAAALDAIQKFQS